MERLVLKCLEYLYNLFKYYRILGIDIINLIVKIICNILYSVRLFLLDLFELWFMIVYIINKIVFFGRKINIVFDFW